MYLVMLKLDVPLCVLDRPICPFSSLNRYMHGSLGYVSRYVVIYNLIIKFLDQSHILLKITSCRQNKVVQSHLIIHLSGSSSLCIAFAK